MQGKSSLVGLQTCSVNRKPRLILTGRVAIQKAKLGPARIVGTEDSTVRCGGAVTWGMQGETPNWLPNWVGSPGRSGAGESPTGGIRPREVPGGFVRAKRKNPSATGSRRGFLAGPLLRGIGSRPVPSWHRSTFANALLAGVHRTAS
jgi:hypothetical protein